MLRLINYTEQSYALVAGMTQNEMDLRSELNYYDYKKKTAKYSDWLTGVGRGKQPDAWNAEGFVNFFNKEIKEIAKRQTGIVDKDGNIVKKEWGFFALWNPETKEMRASNYIEGIDEKKLGDIENKEFQEKIGLKKNEVVVGFFHTHPYEDSSYENQFSDKDLGNLWSLFEGIAQLPIGSDRSVMFMGVAIPSSIGIAEPSVSIQIIQVGNVETFRQTQYDVQTPNSPIRSLYYYNPWEINGIIFYPPNKRGK